jgi:hypothetical protein
VKWRKPHEYAEVLKYEQQEETMASSKNNSNDIENKCSNNNHDVQHNANDSDDKREKSGKHHAYTKSMMATRTATRAATAAAAAGAATRATARTATTKTTLQGFGRRDAAASKKAVAFHCGEIVLAIKAS